VVKRYDMVERTRGMESWHELQVQSDGDYVEFADYAALGERFTKDRAALAARLAEAERKLAAIQSAAGNVCWYSYGDCDHDVQDAVLALERHVPDYCIVYKAADSATDDRFDRPIVRLNNYP
jgi:hypothetical protein